MSSFDERERAYEALFTYGETLLFRIRSRRDRLAGDWAARMMGLCDDEAAAYAAQLAIGGPMGPGTPDLQKRLADDLANHGISLSAYRLGKHLDQLLRDAERCVMLDV